MVTAVDAAQVGCALSFDVTAPAELVLQIAAVAATGPTMAVSPASAVVTLPDGQQVLRAAPGRLTISYSATVAPEPAADSPVAEVDRIVALRPSRYCPSDRLAGFTAQEFGGHPDPVRTVRAITDWVHAHLSYQPGSSGPATDAVDTLLTGAGVCRDYAHLVATLCRAADIPARVAAVYAPGLSPMDFHLVVETALDGRWRVWDATRLAPRPTLIRVATGRDAADTALVTTLSGVAAMTEMQVVAVAAGDLPVDDHTGLLSLA
jgi:transglutaminase-like putative cysteine protease